MRAPSEPSPTPSDDPGLWDSRLQNRQGIPRVRTPLKWIIPSEELPEGIEPLPSNNNVDIEYFENALFLAWRTAPTHFASSEARIEVIRSVNEGATWTHEARFAVGADVREPRFHQQGGVLHLTFFEGE